MSIAAPTNYEPAGFRHIGVRRRAVMSHGNRADLVLGRRP